MMDLTLTLELMAVMGVIAYIALLIIENIAVDIDDTQDAAFQKRSLLQQHVVHKY